VALLRLEGAQLWKLECLFSGSHTDIVRSVIWDEQVRKSSLCVKCNAVDTTPYRRTRQNSVVVTGSEDSCVSLWSIESGNSTAAGTEQTEGDSESMDIDEPVGSASWPVRGSKRERDGDGNADAGGVERPETTKRVKSVSFFVEPT